MRKEARLGPPDVGLFSVVILLVVAGVILVYDSSYAKTGSAQWAGYDACYMVKRQAVYSIIGVCAMLVVSNFRLRWFPKITLPLLFLSLALLGAVLIPGIGYRVNEANRWFKVGPISIQPSEISKLAVALYLAGFLAARKKLCLRNKMGWLVPLLIVGCVVGLIVSEPDLGTALCIVCVAFVMLFVSGVRTRYITSLAAIGAGFVWLAVLVKPYRFQRVCTWLDPWQDPFGAAYQIVHSLIALGTGGLTGQGFCQGREKFYLPAASTDFIFSTVGEEFGLIGSCILLSAFVYFTYRGLDIACKCRSNYAKLLGVGVTSIVSLQALINVAVVTSSIPATGVPLPFISYGGSSLVSMLVAAGVLLALSRQTNVTLEERELNESNLVGWRDRGTRISRRKHRTSAIRGRPKRRVAVRW